MVCFNKADNGFKSTSSKRKRPSCRMQQAIADRNQSVELTDQFAALAAIVPGIQEEMDETTVLEASIKYMKQLQERLHTLEGQSDSDRETCTSDENFTHEPHPLPQIEARVSDKNVLIRIHCELCKGILARALDETEKLNLSIVNSSAIPFGDSTLDITITAEINDKFTMRVENLVKSLRSSLIQFTAKNLHHEHDN